MAAATEPSFSLVVYVTPDAPAIGNPMDIHVDAYRGVTPVDPDDLAGTVLFYVGQKENLSFERTGTGRFAAHVVLPHEVARVEPVNVQVSGWSAGDLARAQVYVTPADMPHLATSEAMLFGALVGEGAEASMVGLGQSLVFRLWTFLNGTLEDFEVPSVSGSLWPTGTPSGSVIQGIYPPVVRVGPGTYEFVYQVPEDVAITTKAHIQAKLLNQTDRAVWNTVFTTDPFPATLVVSGLDDDDLEVTTCAGRGSQPVANATVTLDISFPLFYNPSNQDIIYTAPAQSFAGRTGPNGCSTQALPWPGGDTDQVAVSARIDALGGSTFRSVRNVRNGLEVPPTAYGPFPDGFSIELIGQPEPLDPGQVAHLTFAASINGSPYAVGPVGVLPVWEAWPPTPFDVGYQTTDTSGLLNLTFTVPPDARMGFEGLSLALFSPEGYEADYGFTFRDPGFDWTADLIEPDLLLSARMDAANGTVHVDATYTGSQDLTGWRAHVQVAPANWSRWHTVADGQWPWADLTLDGAHLDYGLPVPAWMATGDLLVTVDFYTFGRAAVWPDPTLQMENRTVVRFEGDVPDPVDALEGQTPHQDTPPDATGTSGSVRVADDPPWWLVLLLLVGAAVLVLRRGWARGGEGAGPP